VLNGVLQSENTTLGLGFISNVGITLFHTNHDTGLTGTTDQRRKDGTRGIISGETGCKRESKALAYRFHWPKGKLPDSIKVHEEVFLTGVLHTSSRRSFRHGCNGHWDVNLMDYTTPPSYMNLRTQSLTNSYLCTFRIRYQRQGRQYLHRQTWLLFIEVLLRVIEAAAVYDTEQVPTKDLASFWTIFFNIF
jgi:hypothetical protein